MKLKFILSLSVLFITSVLIIGASKDNGHGIYGPKPKDLIIPPGWPKPAKNIFANNKLTEEGFSLGKKLFYDPMLSKDGQISCASCHQQFAAFATYDHDLSHGVNNTFSSRNAPGLFNLAWRTDMHWDGSINHIEVQPLSPLTAPNEMGETIQGIMVKLMADTLYKRMFKAAFGDTLINSQRMLKALAQFTGSLVSSNSKYDKVKQGKAVFTPYEEKGYTVFKNKCASCHKEPFFTDNSFRNNGLSLNRFADIGRQKVTQDSRDSLKFRVPSLRNAQLTFPYMHDGRIYSISQVIEHYRTGIITEQPTLDSSLRNRIILSDLEKNELVYFIYTLTDSGFVRDFGYAPDRSSRIFTPSPDKH